MAQVAEFWTKYLHRGLESCNDAGQVSLHGTTTSSQASIPYFTTFAICQPRQTKYLTDFYREPIIKETQIRFLEYWKK